MVLYRASAIAAGVCAVLFSSASAQVHGVVRAVGGPPIPDALVELWSAGHRLAGTGTDTLGRFRFAAPQRSGPLALLIRRIGFTPSTVRVAESDTTLDLVLELRPVRLAETGVSAPRDECVTREEADARALYSAAAKRYDPDLSASGVQAWTLRYSAIVSPDSLGLIDTSRLARVFIRGGARRRWRPAGTFYATATSGILFPRFDLWDYPWLESTEAWHFVDTTFTNRNRLALDRGAEGSSVLRFCSRHDSDPYIVGQLLIGSDTSLVSATWRFVVPGSAEEAGGQVFFAPLGPGSSRAPLLPMAGLFWRRRVKDFYQEWMEFRGWSRCPSTTDCRAAVPLN